MFNCCLLQIIGDALRVKIESCCLCIDLDTLF